MKIVNFFLSTMLLVGTAHANDVVQLIGPYNVSFEKAQNSVVNFYLPQGSIGVVGLTGGDEFSEAQAPAGIFETISKNKKTIFLKTKQDEGESASSGISTKCGLTLSVVIHTIAKTSAEGTIKPKLSINTPANCI
ncbi:hypothetical protein L1D11_14655 [Vibrio sp. Isolate32]|uniref:hypothetical protein n=2 Tax=unclassified Vibrio TaxID=2614977 RepID=UPI001EFEE5DE|nr:hypothetical protein [Vibrio sp. Isolate32]MCG9554569.1 hypothetical protein [Vibrio sp. Isolate32]